MSVQRIAFSMFSAVTAWELSRVAVDLVPTPVSIRPPSAYTTVVRIQPPVLSLFAIWA